MSQKIIRIGSSLGVTVPKRLLDKLSLSASDEVELNFNPRHDSIEIIAVKKSTGNADSLFSEVKQIINDHQAEFSKLED